MYTPPPTVLIMQILTIEDGADKQARACQTLLIVAFGCLLLVVVFLINDVVDTRSDFKRLAMLLDETVDMSHTFFF